MSVHEPAAQRASAWTVGEAKIDQSHISARRVSERLIHRSNDTDNVVARLLHYAVQLDRDQLLVARFARRRDEFVGPSITRGHRKPLGA